MRRFFVETIAPENGLLSITGKEAGHMRRVLRMKKGDVVIIMDGKGNSFESIIESVHTQAVTVKIIKALPSLAPSPVTISLAQALLKSGPMDYLIQKVTELGVNSLSMCIPALLAYSIFKLRAFSKSKEGFIISALSFISAFSSVMFSAFFISLFLVSAGNEFFETAKIVLAIHAPIAVIEGLITVFIISFLYKVKPDMIMN